MILPHLKYYIIHLTKLKILKFIAIVTCTNFCDIFLVLNIHIYKISHFAYLKCLYDYSLSLFEIRKLLKDIHIFTSRVLIFNDEVAE